MKKLIILALLFLVTGTEKSSAFWIKITTEGFYRPATNLSIQREFVLVDIRETTSPYAFIDQTVIFTDSVSLVGRLYANAGTYYLVFRHWNHLETWSAQPVTINSTDTIDFTSDSSKFYGSNVIRLDSSPLVYGLYGGDVNQDDAIDATDVALVDTDAQNFVTGYPRTNIYYEGPYVDIVDATDVAIVDNHAQNFIATIRP